MTEVPLRPTHYYKGRPVEFVAETYTRHGQRYCTIRLVNKWGRIQRQTVQWRHLVPIGN